MSAARELIDATDTYIIPSYGQRVLAAERGEGARLWDADGKEYIDFFAGFGGAGIGGHCHPKIADAVQCQARTLWCHGNFFTSRPQVDLARRIVENGFGGKVFFGHSGADAVEAALKLVRRVAGDGRYKIISFHGCFHGRSMGALSLTPEKYQAGFEPMLPGNVKADYGDLDSVAALIDDETAGVFVEPIQGEGGVNVPDASFLKGLRTLCDERGLVLVCDEVWTGPARTGRWYAHQHFGIEPDVMTLAKALGGGAPISACVASPKYADVLSPGTHASTMGGNPLCAAGGVAAMDLIAEEGLVDRAAEKGAWLCRTLREAQIGCVREVRGHGMLIGIELDAGVEARPLFLEAMQRGLLIGYAQTNVLRLAPPLITPDDLLDRGVGMLVDLLRSA
ncbi:MAG: acetylornithine transaminase [Phycisphaerae bacterium]|nr:acetylornithine transaminase [Phycisphaerae bacterium]